MLRQTKLTDRVPTLSRYRIAMAGSHNLKISIVLYLLAIIVIAAGPACAQSSNSDYVAGIQSYFQGDFNNCIHTLDRVVRLVTLTKDELCEARTFMGASHLQLGDSISARNEFEQAIRLVPDYVIGLDFTPVIRHFYLALRDRAFVTLSIDSAPSGVALSIDGQPVGQTPYRLDSVFAGDTFDVRLTPDPCFRPYETEVQVREDRPNRHMFGLERILCPLSVNLTPEDVTYIIEDSTGRQLLWQDSVPCGQSLTARLRRDGFWSLTVPVECQESGGAHLEATMTKLPRSGGGKLKYIASVLSIAALGVFLDADEAADRSYQRYLDAETQRDQDGHRDSLQRYVDRRKRAGWIAAGFGTVSLYLWVKYLFFGTPDPDSRSNPHDTSSEGGVSVQLHDDMPGLTVSVGI